MENKEKQILIAAMHSRKFLFFHDFLSEKEAKKVFDRISKYQDKHRIEVTKEELEK
jgi:hypothetical protein